jgi:ankyrin repeat protein
MRRISLERLLLHYASMMGHKEVAGLLITNGADVNANSNIGASLHIAVFKGHKEIVELLIANGADVNAKSDFGTTLDLADGETADLLRKHGGKTSEELKAESK